ncbi:molybdopterin-dependent oxidoreductase [Anianabacter salinae]|uniref:molybdopterin-dependent oxidoreductase n=1 Tax=Anianabacter salinae TaxID=2851023 RepID=UPI00225DDFFC|nr:molybdopterin-dependent oxidoreductase [Anianabacter salinae]MBV0913749.1 molybdopterin-dependent oxidoreductase [Anianabacter salinae]
MTRRLMTRRAALTGLVASPMILSGCDRLGQSPSFRNIVLSSGEWLSYRMHRLFGANAMAREYTEAEMSPDFRTNGSTRPQSAEYQRHLANGFATWSLKVSGLVEEPQAIPLADLRAMPSRTQITRHDCVEGWSAIGKWTGVPLGAVLDRVMLKPEARYIVFRCADALGLSPYYESIDLVDAFHPQTILAYGMNGSDLSQGHGAPIRLRVERQLGYKHAKFIMEIEAVDSLSDIGLGRGGYWEDTGFYEWYAGI